MIAVVPVREGQLPAGADAAVMECDGRVLVIGSDVEGAAATLRASVSERWSCEAGPFAPAAWAGALARELADERQLVLPASPDGRDLAGRLAAAMGRPCHAWCTRISSTQVVLTRLDGAQAVTLEVDGPFVATLVPVRFPDDVPPAAMPPAARVVDLWPSSARDASVLRVDDADPAEVDLAESSRILAGGVGLGGSEEFSVLAEVAAALGASLGATRPVADRGVVGHERQIGTTGAMVDPDLYLAFGISGAVQHTAGLGHPERVVSVNLDASCPMMAMSDLAVVADAPATLRALAHRLAEASR